MTVFSSSFLLVAFLALFTPRVSPFAPRLSTVSRRSAVVKSDAALSEEEASQKRIDAIENLNEIIRATNEMTSAALFDMATDPSEANPHVIVKTCQFELPLEKPIIKGGFPWKTSPFGTYEFDYEYSELSLAENPSTAVLLIHPIGVGIGRWYYNRLLQQLPKNQRSNHVFLVPDLLGSSSACNPIIRGHDSKKVSTTKLPLLTIDDWSSQLVHLMQEYQESHPHVTEWCVVANGGCATIRLDLSKQNILHQIPVTQLILLAPPRLSGLLRESPNPKKLSRTYYRTLLGLPGKLFWWYSLRNDGAFIQKFSEQNLAASPKTLGAYWRSQCVESAQCFQQRSKHSTFAFLAGALQRNCQPYFDALADSKARVDVILPETTLSNGAQSWVWQKRKTTVTTSDEDLVSYLQRQKLGGDSRKVGGRRCVAHEDAIGFSNALLELLSGEES